MKILLVSHSSKLYGAERSLLDLAEGLVRTGHDISAVCPGPGPLAQELQKTGIPVFHRPLPGIGGGGMGELLRFFLLLPGAVFRFARWIRSSGFDVVYSNTINAVHSPLAARLAGVRSVWHIREVKPGRAFLARIGGVIINLLSTDAVFNSYATMRAFRSKPPASWHVIYNGVELPQKSHSDRSHTLSFLIGYAGQMTEHKKPERFLHVFSQVKTRENDVRGIMAGDGWMLPGLSSLAESLGIANEITFAGFLSDLEDFYSTIDVLVLTSERESFGRVIMEAMRHGRAVVAAAVDGVPELVEDGKTGYLVPAGDIKAYSQKILSLINDPENCRRMGEAGRRRVSEYFSKSRYQQEMIRILTIDNG